jgi:very-short-patch-repair endonuclease
MPMIRKTALARRREFKHGFANSLRTNTDAERLLWWLLRDRRIDIRFRRRQPIGPYIADFFCPAAKLVIELDGDRHGANAAAAHDEIRSQFLSGRGYRVLRFFNHEVFRDPRRVLETILDAVHKTGRA